MLKQGRHPRFSLCCVTPDFALKTTLFPPHFCNTALTALFTWILAWIGLGVTELLGEVPGKGVRELRNSGALEELARVGAAVGGGQIRPIEGWLAGEAMLELGRTQDLLKLAERLEKELPGSFSGAFLRYRACRYRGDTAGARAIAEERTQSKDVTPSRWVRDSSDWVLLGKLRLAAGSDAKQVLETCFERALKEDGNCEEAVEAIVELALDRGDAEMAAKRAREGLKRFARNPRLLVLLGKAQEWGAHSDSKKHLGQALEINSREVSAHRALAETAFRAEDEKALWNAIEKLPAHSPDALAFRLATGLMSADEAEAAQTRKKCAGNALALHQAGILLSSRYRFTEGAELQKAALQIDPRLLSARRALAEDFLRTGHMEESWPMLEAIQKEDPYDVTVFNLLELRDRVKRFKKVETPHFVIHMAELEAAVYGDRVAALLERAHAELTQKYGASLPSRTIVEIFPEQKDFAVRTFGVPGGDGYLGVCFGPVITAPSPASPRASGHSWEATLWHEFTHTVTLALTQNRIPRWLSEGISVYEEQQAKNSWGQRFKPRYASRLLSGKLTPLESMAEPFRSGEPAELDFAYFQAGLLVEWMVQKSGTAGIRRVLLEIAKGCSAPDALRSQFGSAARVDEEFKKFALNWAQKMAGGLRFRAANSEVFAARSVYEDLVFKGAKALEKKDIPEARKNLETAVGGAPEMRDPEGAYPMLARLYRELGMEAEEAQTWERALELLVSLPEAHGRLLEIYSKRKDWDQVQRVCGLSLGVHPMSLRVLETLVGAQEGAGLKKQGAETCLKALRLDAEHASRWHCRIGMLLEASDPLVAREHLFLALEKNPRDQRALEAFARVMNHVQKAAGKEGQKP